MGSVDLCGTASQAVTIVSWRLSRFLRKAPNRTTHSSSSNEPSRNFKTTSTLWFLRGSDKAEICAEQVLHDLSTTFKDVTVSIWAPQPCSVCLQARFLHVGLPIYKASRVWISCLYLFPWSFLIFPDLKLLQCLHRFITLKGSAANSAAASRILKLNPINKKNNKIKTGWILWILFWLLTVLDQSWPLWGSNVIAVFRSVSYAIHTELTLNPSKLSTS